MFSGNGAGIHYCKHQIELFIQFVCVNKNSISQSERVCMYSAALYCTEVVKLCVYGVLDCTSCSGSLRVEVLQFLFVSLHIILVIRSTAAFAHYSNGVHHDEVYDPQSSNNNPHHPHRLRRHDQKHTKRDLSKSKSNDKESIDSVKPLPTDTIS